MTDIISPIPKVPQQIVEAVNNRNLAVFIGAGVSRIIGCCGWDELARKLAERCFSTRRDDGSSLISYKELETISQYRNHKKIITVCHHILLDAGYKDVFFQELEQSLEAREDLLRCQNVYDELYGLRAVFITTNADMHFHSRFEKRHIVYRPEDLDPSNVDRGRLFHIHGCIQDKDSLVFTVSKYLERYKNARFKGFLESVFKRYVVLFAGYGLDEFELLAYAMDQTHGDEFHELKRFVLLPMYQGEENILEFERAYYHTMGIEVLAFQKDVKGHAQLYEVVKAWNREINLTSSYLMDSMKEIEQIVNNCGRAKP